MKISYYNILVSDPQVEESASDHSIKTNVELELPENDELIFKEEPLADQGPYDFRCRLNNKQRTPSSSHFLFGPGFLAVSSELRDSLTAMDKGILEFLKTDIINHQDGVISHMHILHPLTMLDGINFDQTECTQDDTGTILTCKKLVLYGGQTFSKNMFVRLREWPRCLLINRWRYIDNYNWLNSHYDLPYTCSAFATGKISRKKSFPEPGVEEFLYETLEKTSTGLECRLDFDMSKVEVDLKKFSDIIYKAFGPSPDWLKERDLISGTLEETIKQIHKTIKKHQY